MKLKLSKHQSGLGFESSGEKEGGGGGGGGKVRTRGVGMITVGVGVIVDEEEHWDNRNLLQILCIPMIPIGETK